MQEPIVPLLTDYAAITDVLTNIKALVGAAEAHGVICGLICAGNLMNGKLWLERLLGIAGIQNAQSNECREALIDLYEVSSGQLQDESLSFKMLLPSDESTIQERVEALGNWCHGFLTGLELAGVNGESNEDEEIDEVLADINEIANVNYDLVEAADEDEAAYMEIVEYLRMGIIMLYHEFSVQQSEETEENNHGLH